MNTHAWKNMYWLVKREFWEHRGGFLWAPVITGGIFLLLNIMGLVTAEVLGARHGIHIGAGGDLQQVISRMDSGDMSTVGMALDITMYSAMALISVVLGFVVFFYCLGSLYDDRRDRSILFWKSLPISNTSTVLSKVISAGVLAPVIAVAVGIVAGMLQLVMVAVVLSFHGINVWQLLMLAHPIRVTANLIGYLPIYLLWALPALGWLMLCSAWSRNKPFLWAVTLPVATGLMVTWFDIMGLFDLPAAWFWGHVVQRALLSVFPGSSVVSNLDDAGSFGHVPPGEQGFGLMDLSQSYHLLAMPILWAGVLAGVGLIAAAIWFRRWRDDS